MVAESELVVCLFMIDGQRLVTKFPMYNKSRPKFEEGFDEKLMLEILNKCESFILIKSYKDEFVLEDFDDLVINKNNIVSIKTMYFI